jgi:hypothetical protein
LPQPRRRRRSAHQLRCPPFAPLSWCHLHVVRVGTASVLIGGALGYPLHHHGRTSVPGAATTSAGRRSWSSASSSMTILTRLVGLSQPVLRARRHTALLPSTLLAGSELRGGMPSGPSGATSIGSVAVAMPPQGARWIMLELPLLQASG